MYSRICEREKNVYLSSVSKVNILFTNSVILYSQELINIANLKAR